jgi:hypothetical protein
MRAVDVADIAPRPPSLRSRRRSLTPPDKRRRRRRVAHPFGGPERARSRARAGHGPPSCGVCRQFGRSVEGAVEYGCGQRRWGCEVALANARRMSCVKWLRLTGEFHEGPAKSVCIGRRGDRTCRRALAVRDRATPGIGSCIMGCIDDRARTCRGGDDSSGDARNGGRHTPRGRLAGGYRGPASLG